MSVESDQIELPNIERPAPLRDRVYEIVRKNILNGDFPPGYKLVEEQLAAQLGVSRTPVREAIQRLEVEGLVVGPHKGNARVQQITPESIGQALEIRELLETFACQRAAEKITDDQINHLRELHQRELEALTERDPEVLSDINTRIHHGIMSASGNQVLLHLVKLLAARVPSYRFFALGDLENLEVFIESHGGIIDALAEGDAETAEREMAEHVNMARKILSQSMSSDRDEPEAD